MKRFSVQLLAPVQLSRLLNVDHMPLWNSDDAAAALVHQLDAPLWPDLACVYALDCDLARRLSGEQTLTFRDQLLGGRAALPFLQAIKRFGRHVRDQEASPLRGAPGTVLYFAAIAAAAVQHRCQISRLTDDRLADGYSWSLVQAGASSLAPLFRSALIAGGTLTHAPESLPGDWPHRSSWRG